MKRLIIASFIIISTSFLAPQTKSEAIEWLQNKYELYSGVDYKKYGCINKGLEVLKINESNGLL